MISRRKKKCVIDSCNKTSNDTRRKFYEFPSNSRSRALWVKSLGLQEPLVCSAEVCSRHFDEQDFRESAVTRKRLKLEAVPHLISSEFESITLLKHVELDIPCPQDDPVNPHDPDISCVSPSPIKPIPCLVDPDYGSIRDSSSLEDMDIVDTSTNIIIHDKNGIMPRDTIRTQTSVQTSTKSLEGINTALKRKIRCLEKQVQGLKSLVEDLTSSKDSATNKQLGKITNAASTGDHAALYLLDQIKNFGRGKCNWSESTIRYCIVWRLSSTKGYEHVRRLKLIQAPCRSTLEKYMGKVDYGVGVSELAKQRLLAECTALPSVPIARFASLVIDEMSIKEKLEYDKSCDKYFGLIETCTVEEKPVGKYPTLANKLLCFVIHGLAFSYAIPAAYYMTRSVSSTLLYELTINTIADIEKCGFFIIRIVTDNHRSNVGLFKQLGGGELKSCIPHPLRPETELFMSFDYCHVIKNIRSQFLKNDMADKEGVISSRYVKEVHRMQQNLVIKPIRFLTTKHIDPTNFEQMNVLSAVQLFSLPVTASIEFIMNHSERCPNKVDFSDAGPTIKFMKTMRKFFSVHDTSDRVQYLRQKDPDKRHFSSVDDERLHWLKVELPEYINEVRVASKRAGLKGFTKETREAIAFTAKASHECVEYLLHSGFYYVLTRNFSSDPVEATFSTIRFFGGSNDVTDARAATFAIRRILRSGLITASNSANVAAPGQANYHSTVETAKVANLADNTDETGENAMQISVNESHEGDAHNAEQEPEGNIGSYLSDNAANLLEKITNPIQSAPYTTLESASQALVGGFVVKAITDKLNCIFCHGKISMQKTSSPLLDLVHIQDMGGYKYPTSGFVLLIKTVQDFTEVIVQHYYASTHPYEEVKQHLLPALIKSPILQCDHDKSHAKIMAEVLIDKFVRPVLRNIGKKCTANAFKTRVQNKPKSRKVLKL